MKKYLFVAILIVFIFIVTVIVDLKNKKSDLVTEDDIIKLEVISNKIIIDRENFNVMNEGKYIVHYRVTNKSDKEISWVNHENKLCDVISENCWTQIDVSSGSIMGKIENKHIISPGETKEFQLDLALINNGEQEKVSSRYDSSWQYYILLEDNQALMNNIKSAEFVIEFN